MPRMRLLPLLLLACLAAASATAQRHRAVGHPSSPSALYPDGGYADQASVEQGRDIAFHISSRQSPITIEVVNLAARDRVLATIEASASPYDCSGRWETGCGWPVAARLTIPVTWTSGYYAARFVTTDGTRFIPFVVRAASPGSTSRTLIVMPTHTYQAYNSFGGKSVYPSNSPSRAFKVTYDRPYLDTGGLGLFRTWEDPFLKWMKSEGRSYEAATDVDLEDPTLLPRYALVVIVGHSEYWTANARKNFEDFSRMGGHVAIFGGNTMWWQSRYEPQGRKLVVYKSATLDPEAGRNDAIVTTNWFAEPVNRPENLITGSSFRYGGYTNPSDTPAEALKSYVVSDPSHWIFAGSGAQTGQAFGRESAGYEVDGALHDCDRNGVATQVDGSDGTPLNFHILAVTPATNGWGTVGIYTNAAGGAVFNAGSQDWAVGLASDPVVQVMTRNVMNRLSTGQPLPYDPVTSSIRTRAFFNCPMPSPALLAGWRGDLGEVTQSARCAYEGPAGLELGGVPGVALARNFAPTANSLRDMHVRFYINADAVTTAVDETDQLLTIQQRQNRVNTRVARLDIMRAATGVQLRLSQYRLDANRGGSTPWMPLGGSGWHSVALRWQSPGAVTLQIDGGAVETIQNLENGQVANEIVLTRGEDKNRTNGFLCVDALAVATEAIAPVPALR